MAGGRASAGAGHVRAVPREEVAMRSVPRRQGVFTALVTPFFADGSLDEEALRRVVRHQIPGRVAGLVPVGTTGEAATLSPEEHARVVEVTVDEAGRAARRIKVIAGAGTN